MLVENQPYKSKKERKKERKKSRERLKSVQTAEKRSEKDWGGGGGRGRMSQNSIVNNGEE